MFENLDIMRMAHGLARHASDRQEIVARNVANADTPGFRARDLASFQQIYSDSDQGAGMRTTREGHLGAADLGVPPAHLIETPGEASPNGNTVSIETEIFKSAEIKSQHDRATTIYKTSLDVLRTSLGRGR
ncbi:FlgB family protein [Roseitranquillus sediminis]|uniref:FlgB family protein n=1 Tax=Roseitranquillus sediminis TaxID=2809051 RepID=UPI001D0CB675|nr:FlgB family protein [Roseitranquillus sediminis]MBM9596118.1 FlgB family protein [Roseitranquillus sediminis]